MWCIVVRLIARSNQFVSAVRLGGNKINERKVVFTQEFKSWLAGAVGNYFGDKAIPKNVATVTGVFECGANVEFNLEKKLESAIVNGLGKLIYLSEYMGEQCTVI